MRGTDAPILPQMLTAVTNWRTVAAAAGVDLVQVNVVLPDNRTVVLSWGADEIDNGDGTRSGDWVIDT